MYMVSATAKTSIQELLGKFEIVFHVPHIYLDFRLVISNFPPSHLDVAYSPLPVSEGLILYLVVAEDKGLGRIKNKGQGVD